MKLRTFIIILILLLVPHVSAQAEGIKLKYAKKYNYSYTNSSIQNEENAALYRIKTDRSGILQFMFETNSKVNVRFLDSKKKALSDVFTVEGQAFSGIGVKSNKVIYAKIWCADDVDVNGTTELKKLKYQIKTVTTANGSSKSKARKLKKGKYVQTLIPAGKATTSWFNVKLNKSQKLSITVESRMLQNKGDNLCLYICNSKGKKLNSTPIIIDGETTVVYNKKYIMKYPKITFGTTAKFPSGTYYLKVVSKTKISSGSYRIKWK